MLRRYFEISENDSLMAVINKIREKIKQRDLIISAISHVILKFAIWIELPRSVMPHSNSKNFTIFDFAANSVDDKDPS